MWQVQDKVHAQQVVDKQAILKLHQSPVRSTDHLQALDLPSSTAGDGAGAIRAAHTCDVWQGTWIRAGMPAGPTIGQVCQEVDIAATRWGALVCRALGDGVAVAGIALRLALVPWQLVCVILEELVASRPVLVALQAEAIMRCQC
jgi:hypothetical protein